MRKPLRTPNNLADKLREISRAIEQHDIAVQFPAPDTEIIGDCPFVDKACEAIGHGGTLDATSLASLIYYIADMMEM